MPGSEHGTGSERSALNLGSGSCGSRTLYGASRFHVDQEMRMSLSNEWTEWHLTPAGWVRGTEKEDFRTVDPEPPPDRVKTVVWHDRLSSRFSKPERSHDETWSSPD